MFPICEKEFLASLEYAILGECKLGNFFIFAVLKDFYCLEKTLC